MKQESLQTARLPAPFGFLWDPAFSEVLNFLANQGVNVHCAGMSAPHPYNLQAQLSSGRFSLAEVFFGPQEPTAFSGFADALKQFFTGSNSTGRAVAHTSSAVQSNNTQLANMRMAAAANAVRQSQNG